MERENEKFDVERHLLPINGSTSPLPSTLALSKQDASPAGSSYISKSSSWFVIMANVLLFVTSVILLMCLPYRRANGLNHALKQVSSYCKFHAGLSLRLSIQLANEYMLS